MRGTAEYYDDGVMGSGRGRDDVLGHVRLG